MNSGSDEDSRASRVLVFSHYFPPAVKGGGPLRTVDALTAAAPRSFDVRVITSDRDLGESTRLPVERNMWTTNGTRLVHFGSTDRLLSFVGHVRHALGARPAYVYVNSFFDPLFGLLPQVLSYDTALIVAPRGEFALSALESKPGRKRLLLRWYRTLGLHRRVIWHASSERERADVERLWGSSARIIVRENETSLPARSHRRESSSDGPAGSRPLSVAVAGRVVPTKGLDILMEALPRITKAVNIDVYGNLEDERYARRCVALAEESPAHVRVRFHGSLENAELQRRLKTHDVMATPTHGENFGHVVAESLAAGCPVAMADVSPWTPVLSGGGGLVVESNTPSSWSTILDDLAGETPSQRAERHRAASDAYDLWRAEQPDPHVFEQAAALRRRGSDAGSSLR